MPSYSTPFSLKVDQAATCRVNSGRTFGNCARSERRSCAFGGPDAASELVRMSMTPANGFLPLRSIAFTRLSSPCAPLSSGASKRPITIAEPLPTRRTVASRSSGYSDTSWLRNAFAFAAWSAVEKVARITDQRPVREFAEGFAASADRVAPEPDLPAAAPPPLARAPPVASLPITSSFGSMRSICAPSLVCAPPTLRCCVLVGPSSQPVAVIATRPANRPTLPRVRNFCVMCGMDCISCLIRV